MKHIQPVALIVLGMLVFGLSTPRGYAGQELQFDDIVRMLEHTGQESYIGAKFIVDYMPTRRSTTLVKVANDASGMQKMEISPLQDGESQIILDDGKFLWHYIPSQASVMKKQRRLDFAELSKRLLYKKDLIQQNYTITVETNPEPTPPPSMPHPALVPGDITVLFQPKSQDRPSWKIWIDSTHNLVVRTEIYYLDGSLAMLSAFTELTFHPQLSKDALTMTVPKGTTVRTSIEETFQTIEEAQPRVSFPISSPAYLPPGFLLWSVIVSKNQQQEKIQLTYIDGMSSISMFEDQRAAPVTQETADVPNVPITNTVKGTFHDLGLLKVLNWQFTEQVAVTLIGEVAETELLKMAASITPTPETTPQ